MSRGDTPEVSVVNKKFAKYGGGRTISDTIRPRSSVLAGLCQMELDGRPKIPVHAHV